MRVPLNQIRVIVRRQRDKYGDAEFVVDCVAAQHLIPDGFRAWLTELMHADSLRAHAEDAADFELLLTAFEERHAK